MWNIQPGVRKLLKTLALSFRERLQPEYVEHQLEIEMSKQSCFKSAWTLSDGLCSISSHLLTDPVALGNPVDQDMYCAWARVRNRRDTAKWQDSVALGNSAFWYFAVVTTYF